MMWAVLGAAVWTIAVTIAFVWLVMLMHRRVLGAYDALFVKLANVQSIGTPTPAPVQASTVPDAEERVNRMISEDTIARGMQQLRDTVYRGQVVEDEVLRSEVMSMLAGAEPVPRVFIGVPKD